MNNFLRIFFLAGLFQTVTAQTSKEQLPVFPECQLAGMQQEACFYNTLQNFVYHNFKVPAAVTEKNYKGTVIALFEVDTLGTFKVLYTDAAFPELIEETQRVFGALPKVEPAKYSGKPTYAKYSIKIAIPLVEPLPYQSEEEAETAAAKPSTVRRLARKAKQSTRMPS